MAKDDRIWAKFAVDMPDNPKVLPLSDAAFRCLIEATMYARRMLTDGFLASRLAVAKWGLEVLQELCSNDPDKPSLIEVEGGYLIHDFTEHQETKAEIEAKRERNRANGRKGGVANAKRLAKQGVKPTSSHAVAETETETDINKPLKAPLKRGGKGSRLDKDWMPSAEDVAVVAEQCPGFDTQREHLNFVEYWLSVPGQKGVKLSWSMTWRSWMRRAYDRLPPSQKPTRERKVRRFNDEDF